MKTAKLSYISAIALGGFLVFSQVTRAQDQTKDITKPEAPSRGLRVRKAAPNQLDHLATQLKLSDDQKAKLQPIFQEEAKKIRDLRQDTSLSQSDRRTKARAIREEYLPKIKAQLTAEQFDQYKKLRDQAPRRGSSGTAKPSAHPAQTDDQAPAK